MAFKKKFGKKLEENSLALPLTEADISWALQVLLKFGENLEPASRKLKSQDLAQLLKVRIQDNEVDQLVGAALQADWETVFKILSNNPSIINCIPSKRSWGVLHQAAWFNDFKVVEQLLAIPTCDPFIKTKQDRNEYAKPRTTADKLTQDIGLANMIETAQKNKVKIAEHEIPTFVGVKNQEIDSILLTLACFRGSVYPDNIKSKESLVHSKIMHDVFEYIDTGDQWKIARRDVGRQLQALEFGMGNFLVTGDEKGNINDEKGTKGEFYQRVIALYTEGRNLFDGGEVYKGDSALFHFCLNRSLRSASIQNKPTLGEDLAYSVYSILLNAILMYWPALEKNYQPIVYRGMLLDEKQIQKYKKNTKFTWLNFTSTSLNQKVGEIFCKRVIFLIQTTPDGIYSGKRVVGLPDEEEVLFPSRASFKVTKVGREVKGLTRISIRLLEDA